MSWTLPSDLKTYLSRWPDETKTVKAMYELISAYPPTMSPSCLDRELLSGHVTSSAWIVNPSRSRVLLTHHRKLNIWVQMGGHVDGEVDIEASALREAEEESGLRDFTVLGQGIFDIDIHAIPERKDVPAHLHYDVRYCLEADDQRPLVCSDESHEIAWIDMSRLETVSNEESLLRMRRKTSYL